MRALKTRAMVAAVLFAAPACSSLTDDCTVRTEVVEIIWDSIEEPVAEWELENKLSHGWECSDEAVRNLAGAEIGEKWTCTICD